MSISLVCHAKKGARARFILRSISLAQWEHVGRVEVLAVDVAVIEDTGWESACMSCCIAHLAHLSKLTLRFLISTCPFAEIQGGSSAMKAFACVSTAMVASTLLQHPSLLPPRILIDIDPSLLPPRNLP